MNKPTFNDIPRWWCGSCVKRIDGVMNTPPPHCICFHQETQKRLAQEQSGSILIDKFPNVLPYSQSVLSKVRNSAFIKMCHAVAGNCPIK